MSHGQAKMGVRDVKQEYWRFTQWFRKTHTAVQQQTGPGEVDQDHDHITAIEFDDSGRFLATGDKSGNIVVLENDPGKAKNVHFSFFSEFISHHPDFDFVKSLPVEEKINQVRFGPASSSDGMFLLTTNNKQIKLWKVCEKESYKLDNWNIDTDGKPLFIHSKAKATSPLNTMRSKALVPKLRIPTKIMVTRSNQPSLRKLYAVDVHDYPITSLSVLADKRCFISGDNLRINLWDLNIGTHAYNVLDVKPEDMNELSEIISSSHGHPTDSNIFLYSTSLGNIMTCDLRTRALVDEPTQVFSEWQEGVTSNDQVQEHQTFFNEMTQNITSAKYSRSGKYIFSRDYMSVKIWDTAMEREPVQTIYVHEYLREEMWQLYSNDMLWDPFALSISNKGDVVTGTYSNYFHIFDLGKSTDTFIQASQQVSQTADLERSKKKRDVVLSPPPNDNSASPQQIGKKKKGFGMGLFKKKRQMSKSDNGYPFQLPLNEIEFKNKVLDCAWNPKEDVVAIAGQNNLYVYAKTLK